MELFPLSPIPPDDLITFALLRIDVSRAHDDTVVVTPVGEADLSSVPNLRQALRKVIAMSPAHVIVDLDQLTFIDASTLGVLVEARLRVFEIGGTMQVRTRSRLALRMLTATGLEDMVLHQDA